VAGQVLVLVSGSTDYPTVPDSWKHDEQQRIASILNWEASEGFVRKWYDPGFDVLSWCEFYNFFLPLPSENSAF